MNIYINNGNIIIESFRSINIEVGDILKIEFGDKKSNFIVEKNIEENLYNLREKVKIFPFSLVGENYT